MSGSRTGKHPDLSLTGSQILSARSDKSSHAVFSSGIREARDSPPTKKTSKVQVNKTTINSTAQSSENSPVPLTRGVSEDFLAFFENQGARPKVKNKSPNVKKPTKANMTQKDLPFPGSATSTPRSSRSRQTSTTASNHTRHSIFRPDSPFSVTTLDDGGSTVQNTPQSTARSTGSVADRIASSTPGDRVESSTPRDSKAGLNNKISVLNSSACFESKEMIYNSVTSAQSGRSPRHNQSRSNVSSLNQHKDINTANNRLPQAVDNKKPQKLELRSMQNSYQNATYNVNKTPVNEVQDDSRNFVSKNQAEEYIKKVNMAACVIQHSFKRFVRQRRALRASEAAMKRLLAQKKEEITQKQESAKEDLSKDLQRQKKREERAKRARLDAIQELNKRREQEKLQAKLVAEEEMAMLKASGKVGAKKLVKKSKNRDKPVTNTQQEHHTDNIGHDEKRAPTLNDSSNKSKQTMLSKSFNSDTDESNKQETSAPSHIGTETTLDDLMATLKLLEEEETLPSPPRSKFHLSSDAADVQAKQQADLPVQGSLRELDNETSVEKSAVDDKLKDILSFLDEVETHDKLLELDQKVDELGGGGGGNGLSAVEPPGLQVPTAEEMTQMEQASAAASEVTNTVLKQRLQLDEKSRTVEMLQKALNQQRELTIRHARETEKEVSKRLDVQKNEYEEAIQRHLNFIDQLIDDKRSLGEKCESLVVELKQMEKKYSDKIKTMQETHDKELAKVKEMILAQEKLKREKWIEEKTKKIKDLTVKGLEPEIQRLIGKHKSELQKLKAIQEAELLHSDERAGKRYIQMTEELRDQLAKEKEAACQRERELSAQRYEKQLQAEEEAYQQARRRLYQEIQEEKERLAQQGTRQRQEMDRFQKQVEESHRSSSDLMKKEYEKGREEQEKRHKAELQELKERTAAEREAWQQNYVKKQEAWLLTKERELKEMVRQERDKEIEMVINRLEEDGIEAKEECERAAENRIKRIREKYEVELDELEKSERQAIEKYNQMKAELLEAKGEVERVKVINKQKEQEVDDITRRTEKLNRERDHVQDVVRQEFADKLVATEEENKRIKQEIAEMKSRHGIDIERMKQEIELVNKAKQEEMDAVHLRVKQAIAKKEEVVEQLKQQHQAALKRADHLEGLLDQQRKQILSSGKKPPAL